MSNEQVLEELCYLVARFSGRDHQVRIYEVVISVQSFILLLVQQL